MPFARVMNWLRALLALDEFPPPQPTSASGRATTTAIDRTTVRDLMRSNRIALDA